MTDPTAAPDCGHDAPSLPLDEANARIRAALEPVTERRRVPLRDALGEVLAETIVAADPVPAHDNSAMDGYALRHADAGLDSLRLVGNAFAGHPYDGELGPGECVRIMTGGVVPRGSDAVVMQERVTEADGQVRVQHWPEYGENIRRAGEDLAAGDVILAPGRRITPADLGIIASMGRAEIWVHRPLRVAFFSTGDELRSLGEPLGPGEIFDSNRYSLFGMLSRMGVERVDLGVAPDDRASLSQRLGEAAQAADVIITSGGVSVGEADFMGEILRANGEAHFWSIAMKPGRPLTFGRFQNSWYFGLPGNPVSVMATFTQVVAPALRYLAGEARPPAPRRFRVPCLSPLRKKPGRQEFQRGRLTTGDDGALAVESVGRQGSGMLRSMSQADCFIVLPAEADDVAAGDWVAVEPFQGPLG